MNRSTHNRVGRATPLSCTGSALPERNRPVPFALPELRTAADAKLAASALLKAVADGELTPSEASEISRLLDSYTRILESRGVRKKADPAGGEGDLMSRKRERPKPATYYSRGPYEALD
jgi:hypothetical protein